MRSGVYSGQSDLAGRVTSLPVRATPGCMVTSAPAAVRPRVQRVVLSPRAQPSLRLSERELRRMALRTARQALTAWAGLLAFAWLLYRGI